MVANLVLTNGKVYTQDKSRPGATAIAIRDNKIVAVGNDDEIKSLLSSRGEWLDLGGRAVTPGLVDAHVHFQWFALNLQRIDLYEVPSLDEALARVKKHVAGMEPGRWLEGRGWSQELWPVCAFPTATQLDSATGGTPTLLKHKSGHSAWVNSQALQLAGITTDTPDPAGGEIQRDENGQPTGILMETAIDLVSKLIPPASENELVNAMRTAQEHCWRVGLTGIHDFDGRECFRALQTLRHNGELGLRFVKNIPAYRIDHAVGVGLRSDFGDEWIRIGGIKIFADGALGPRTALMIDPYEGETSNIGIAVKDKEEMMAIASKASANGLSVTVHAIGDRANHDVLDVYEAVRQQEATNGQRPAASGQLRHRIEHVQLLHPSDLNRLAELNVIASMQPTHAPADQDMADRYWGSRARYGYAWRTILDSGATLVFSSDAPIEPIDPLPGICAAVTRARPGQAPWYPQEKVTLNEALHAFTMAAAITSGQTATQGSITPGKLADLTIYEQDLYTVAPEDIRNISVSATLVGGQFKHRTF